VLALVVGALFPVGLRHPLREATADSTIDRPLRKAAIVDAALKPNLNGARANRIKALANYVVQPGDTVLTIAERAGLSVETLIQVNHLVSGDEIVTGEILTLPPTDGRMVTVASGQSVAQITQTYKVDAAVLTAVNNLTDPGNLPAELFIPADGTEPPPPPRTPPAPPTESRRHLVRFIWPTQAALTQGFWPYHPGIDLANSVGTPVVAADAGRVTFANWGSYGIYIEIDHGNGFSTLYGHLSKADVNPGQLVTPGQHIGLMGMTGRATGPHLHFEVRYRGAAQNPLDYLP